MGFFSLCVIELAPARWNYFLCGLDSRNMQPIASGQHSGRIRRSSVPPMEVVDLAFRRGISLKTCIAPVFVLGVPRSGTTWLQSLIASHPAVVTLPETKLFQSTLVPWEPLTYREQYPITRQDRLRRISLVEVEMVLSRIEGNLGFELEEGFREVIVTMVKVGGLDPGLLLNLLMYNVKAAEHKHSPQEVWLEKSPRHLYFLKDLMAWYPRARFVHITRNAVDTIWSMHRTFAFPVFEAIREYRAALCAAHNLPAKRSLVVRYERLVSSPEDEMDRIWRFLDLTAPIGWDGQTARATFRKTYETTYMLALQPRMNSSELPGSNGSSKARVAAIAHLFGFAEKTNLKVNLAADVIRAAFHFVVFHARRGARDIWICVRRVPRGL